MKKPCSIPCPKCGSADISRTFYEKGDDVDRTALHRVKFKRGFVDDSDHVTRDHIEHHCRVCSYEWRTEPLRPNPSTKTEVRK